MGFAGAAPTKPPAASIGAYTATADYCAEPEELAFLDLINAYRAQHGKRPLVPTQTLGGAAEHHSADMATPDDVSPTRADGTTWSQNLTNHGYTYSTYCHFQ